MMAASYVRHRISLLLMLMVILRAKDRGGCPAMPTPPFFNLWAVGGRQIIRCGSPALEKIFPTRPGGRVTHLLPPVTCKSLHIVA